MSPFKPAEIRIIIFLSVLVLAGSILNLLKRQGHISDLDLGIFTEKKYYAHEYTLPIYEPPVVADTANSMPKINEKAMAESIIDINGAGYYDLQTLPEIGPVIAGRIIAYRDSVGRFEQVEDLLKISGIGPAKLGKIRDRVRIR